MQDRGASATLDDLSAAATAGDRDAENELFLNLRVRLLAIAKRRIRAGDVQDVVQDSLQIICAKYKDRNRGQPVLAWSAAVLRNVIGNYYQRQKRDGRLVPLEDGAPDPNACGPGVVDGPAGEPTDISIHDAVRRLTLALDLLSAERPRCGSIFRAVLADLDQGFAPREIMSRALELLRREKPDTTQGSFYVTLHRCRSRLREILTSMETESRRSPRPEGSR